MADNKNQTQSRFLLAVTLSLGVFMLWTYFFPPPKAPVSNANADSNIAQTENSNVPNPVSPSNPATLPTKTAQTTPDTTPNKIITIKSPLYEVKLDTRGGLATNWVLKKNRVGNEDKELFSVSSTKEVRQPLELIADEARNKRQLPFRLLTGDVNLDAFLNDRNYTTESAETIELNGSESKKIDFVLRDAANGIEAVKSLTFYADGYVSDLQTKVLRNGQPVPNVKLAIGASIGDQGVNHFTYYSIEPQAVAFVNNAIERQLAVSFADKNGGKLFSGGDVSWAGVADTYFAMAAIPPVPANGVEYQTSKYEFQVREPFYSGIFNWVTGNITKTETRHLTDVLLPIPANGETTKIFVGTKDHYLLSSVSADLTKAVNRPIDLENFVSYGWSWLSWMTRPITVPIIFSIKFLYGLTGNYGLATIIFTLIFYSMLFPLRWYQSKSFKAAAKNAPKMKELQDRQEAFKKQGISPEDPRMRELQMDQLKMTRQSIPLGGCLPLLLQFPLLIAVYTAITISLDFRQATFLWLPDLSAGDPFHILEFMFAGSMAVSMMFTPTAPAVTPEQQMQQKMMTYMMPVMMLFVMWGAASGLLVYWFTGNIIGFAQQMLINRLNKRTEEPPPTETSGTMTKKDMKKAKTSPATS